ncbi:hypothetical protein STPH2_4156 [Streptomyces sp. KO7888]|nr:hypothetical protein [Streptomyces sp. KO7888]
MAPTVWRVTRGATAWAMSVLLEARSDWFRNEITAIIKL